MPSSSFRFYCTLTLLTLWFSFTQPLCHDGERASLLQIKQSFAINKSASYDPLAYPKVASWTHEGDCCLWDGVKCEEDSGHVVSLDLSSSCLYGSIDSNSSLFYLVHLEMLNLADNHFNYSQIPSAINQLSKLTYLNLSFSVFSGQIPFEISKLSNLSFLDLSLNMLELGKLDLKSLIQNMTRLEVLSLSFVNISSIIPTFLANFSSLTSLLLKGCGLRGNLPVEIFHLPNLRILDFSANDLTGELPPFIGELSSLTSLLLSGCKFRGNFPIEIFQLPNLRILDLGDNNLTGELPPFNPSSALAELNIAANNISGELPASIGELSSLIKLDAHNCNISGVLPFSIGKLSQLKYLILYGNNFSGPIPSSLGNLTQLTLLNLKGNHFSGSIPVSFSNLINLETLDLYDNGLSGTVNFDLFLSLKNLTALDMSFNSLLLLIEASANETLPQFTKLALSSCKLSSFPDFLRYQTRMRDLQLGGTHLGGLLPQWLMNISRGTLSSLNLARNSFTGELSAEICKFKSLEHLQLFQNKLSGKLPPCLKNLTSSLFLLNLRGNYFSGSIPEFSEGSRLLWIDLSDNRLQGKVPRSLKNCVVLGCLDLGNNQLNDVFPYWLGTLPKLQILVLKSNGLNGVIGEPQTSLDFLRLRIIDISENNFTRKLPSKYIQNWKAMKRGRDGNLSYMVTEPCPRIRNEGSSSVAYLFSATIKIKGVDTFYGKINEDILVINLSNNYFDGEIPEVIGDLTALYSLDLSRNNLTGGIPSSLANLTKLESLDLSQNMLSGEIPQELTKLNFLQYFNVSHNRLTGEIPQGNHLDTFEASSYEGNLGLCSIPLPKCANNASNTPFHGSPSEDEQEDSGSPFGFGWKVVAIGYACGFVVGLFIGQVVIARRPRWFAIIFQVRNVAARKKGSMRRGNFRLYFH